MALVDLYLKENATWSVKISDGKFGKPTYAAGVPIKCMHIKSTRLLFDLFGDSVSSGRVLSQNYIVVRPQRNVLKDHKITKNSVNYRVAKVDDYPLLGKNIVKVCSLAEIE